VKVGDLVRIIRYGSRHAPDGSIGLIIEKLPFGPGKTNATRHHQVYKIRCNNGSMASQAEFCLELVSESR
jgi:hypothetical protein